MNNLSHGTDQVRRITGSTNCEIARRVPRTLVLAKRQIHLRFDGLVESHLAHVRDDAHDLDPGYVFVGIPDLETPSNWILSGPVLPGHRFVDDCDAQRVFVIAGLEV